MPRDQGRVIDEDRLLQFLKDAVGEDGMEIGITGGQVFVKGPPEAHAKVSAMMDHLSRTLLQSITVEVYSLPAAPDGPSGVLSAADAERLLAGKGAPVELARTVVLLGQPGRLRAGKSTSFVSDYDVEVAQSSAISDPVIRVLQEGLDFQASVGQASDGRMVVKFGCTRCALAEALTARNVASTRLGDIQLPKVRSTVIAGSGIRRGRRRARRPARRRAWFRDAHPRPAGAAARETRHESSRSLRRGPARAAAPRPDPVSPRRPEEAGRGDGQAHRAGGGRRGRRRHVRHASRAGQGGSR